LKVGHYFQAHKISTVTSFPLRAILRNPDATSTFAKWASELVEFELDFLPHHMIKTQALADFITEWMPPASSLSDTTQDNPVVQAPSFTGPTRPLVYI
jgi:hypothetical protein